jgi:peptide/nickel transport system substrate-binding protein
MKWDARAPTNGRALDADDVLFSWKKFGDLNASAVNMVYNATKSPGAAVDSVTAPDQQTIVMKLRKPDAALLTLLAGWDQLYIMPRESDGGFDPKNTIRGHGPWLLDEYVPSSHTNWIKNPDYYNKGRPFPDKLERVLVPEYATRLAQFKAGNIHTDVVQFTPQDVVQLHKDAPKTLIYQSATFSPVSSPNVLFGYEDNSPFRDVRVRRAMAMAIDREAFADTIENRTGFAKDGLDIAVAFNTVLSAGWGDYWLDPKDPAKFGSSVKYLEFHPDDAKQMLTAAGFANGLEFDFFFNQEQTYGAAYGAQVEIFQGMFGDVGLKAKLNGLPYAQWLNNYHYGYIPASYQSGKVKGFNGIGLAAERTRYTPAISLYGLMHPQGDAFHGAVPPSGQGSAIDGDPTLTAMLEKLRGETDRNAAISQAHQVIQYSTENTIYIPKPSTSKFFTVWWPGISNNFSFNSSTVGANLWAENRIGWWIDTSKAPFA